MKMFLLFVGILAFLAGLVCVGRGTGHLNWPAHSMLVNQTKWAYYGAGLAIFCFILIWISRRN